MTTTAHCVSETNFELPGQTAFYRGKVRDVYQIEDLLVMVASDRISAFDHILPRPVPYKGQVLNQIALHFLTATQDIVPNWLLATPDPNVAIGRNCTPIKVEMVIRGYLSGHAWREYKAGKRTLCGVPMPEGMRENDPFPQPIITPATKADNGYDEDISKDEILKKGLARPADYEKIEKYTRQLFKRGTEMVARQGLILVDTKYEFGKKKGKIYLIDEIHTPDSSRYFYKDGYEQRQSRGEHQKQLSKEFVREWLMAQGFRGKAGQSMPSMPDTLVEEVSKRYIQLYETITGQIFQYSDTKDIQRRIENNILNWLKKYRRV